MSAISEWSALDSESSPTSSNPVAARPFSTISPMPGDRALAHRAGDHAGLAEAAPAGAAAEDLDGHALVHRLGERDERLLRVRPGVEVHDGVLGDAPRHPVLGRGDALDAPVGQVADVVERRARRPRRCARGAAAAHGDHPAYPRASRRDECGDHEDRLLAVADDRGVDEVGDRLGVEGRVATGDDDRVAVDAVAGVQRDAGEVEGGEQVGVAELGRERHPEDVEVTDRPVRVDGELRDARAPHEGLHVGPHGIRALARGRRGAR